MDSQLLKDLLARVQRFFTLVYYRLVETGEARFNSIVPGRFVG